MNSPLLLLSLVVKRPCKKGYKLEYRDNNRDSVYESLDKMEKYAIFRGNKKSTINFSRYFG